MLVHLLSPKAEHRNKAAANWDEDDWLSRAGREIEPVDRSGKICGQTARQNAPRKVR
jgi:hypothetical protein